jgi:hypothetical protein
MKITIRILYNLGQNDGKVNATIIIHLHLEDLEEDHDLALENT